MDGSVTRALKATPADHFPGYFSRGTAAAPRLHASRPAGLEGDRRGRAVAGQASPPRPALSCRRDSELAADNDIVGKHRQIARHENANSGNRLIGGDLGHALKSQGSRQVVFLVRHLWGSFHFRRNLRRQQSKAHRARPRLLPEVLSRAAEKVVPIARMGSGFSHSSRRGLDATTA